MKFSISQSRVIESPSSWMSHQRVTPYRPDAYFICLTHLSISGRWGDHLEQLVDDGVDLKYEFLRELVVKAGLSQTTIR